MELRDYQKEIVRLSVNVLKEHKFVYLAMEVRTGKTLTSLSILLNEPKREFFGFNKRTENIISKQFNRFVSKELRKMKI